MKIDKHFKAAESSKSFAIYILCLKLNRAKPQLTIETMISRKNFQEKFQKWAKTQKEEAIESLGDSKEKPKSIPDILGLKPYITIPANISVILLDQIDIKSVHFKPNVYIEKAHNNFSQNEVAKSLENLTRTAIAKQNAMAKTITENSIIFGETRSFFDELKTNVAIQVSSGPAISAHNLLFECETYENAYLTPLLKQRAEMERIKRLIQLTSKYSYLFKLPNLISSHLSRADIDSIIDLYQKHVVILKTYSHLPVFSKVMKQLESTILAVKSFILQEIRKSKRLTLETVNKSIGYLSVIDPKSNATVDVAQAIYEVIENYLEAMWSRVDKQHELPWLTKEEKSSDDLSLKQSAVESLMIRILDRVQNYVEILSKLAAQTSGKKIKRKMQKISTILTKKLSMSLFQDDIDQPLISLSVDDLAFQIKKISATLGIASFSQFCEEFTISVIKTKFHGLQIEISELWKEEIWSKDFENKNGTCVPRIFQCVLIQAITKLQESLPEFNQNILGFVGEGVGLCSVSLLHSMKEALNQSSTNFISKSQKVLLSLSNCEYLLSTVFPQIFSILQGLFNCQMPPQALEAINEAVAQVKAFSNALKDFYLKNKAAKFEKIIEEGITYSEENIGTDANIVYKHLLLQKKDIKEIRSYVFVVIGKFVKITNQLDRKSPQSKKELAGLVIDEIAKGLRKSIQKHHRNLDVKEITQIWVEIEFFWLFVNKAKIENIDKCFHNLRKIFSKAKGLTKLASEGEIFNKESSSLKENLLNREFTKVKLMQACLD